ncbi:VCBS repeat-containing protein [Clostridium sp.]|uniref:VCBS repeat-containing protein n=1 Tax=Clostridium sp. TaxID=1506 RepID=UPI001A3EC0E6|nr:VCBS repeat-containing protein [Clostridium sp.]MBK5236894.1 VCBS repeat-containing protein [Clostridium sp.]
MKLHVVFFKKKFIYYAFTAIIIFIIILTFFLFSRKNLISTFNIVNEPKMIQADLTGDGTKDILYIKTDADKYYIQINSEDKSYYLEPSKKISTVGNYYADWPMRLTLMDISRDNSPEIFTQASLDDKASVDATASTGDTSSIKKKTVSHAFLWNGKKFEDIFCSTNNILGFIDSKNNKTPKVLSGNIKDGKMNFISYIFIQNKLKSFDYNYAENYMGKNTILSFINLMSSFPLAELNISKELFTPDLNGNDISLLSDLSNRKVYYNFQDALFKDYKLDKNGNTSEILWTLNFKGTNTNSTNEPNANILKETKNYTLELVLKLTPKGDNISTFMISSIAIK